HQWRRAVRLLLVRTTEQHRLRLPGRGAQRHQRGGLTHATQLTLEPSTCRGRDRTSRDDDIEKLVNSISLTPCLGSSCSSGRTECRAETGSSSAERSVKISPNPSGPP